jgi:hypothetical protein
LRGTILWALEGIDLYRPPLGFDAITPPDGYDPFAMICQTCKRPTVRWDAPGVQIGDLAIDCGGLFRLHALRRRWFGGPEAVTMASTRLRWRILGNHMRGNTPPPDPVTRWAHPPHRSRRECCRPGVVASSISGITCLLSPEVVDKSVDGAMLSTG